MLYTIHACGTALYIAVRTHPLLPADQALSCDRCCNIVSFFFPSDYFSSFFFLHPMYCPRIFLALPPSSSNSDPGSHSGPSSPFQRYVPSFLSLCFNIQDIIKSQDSLRGRSAPTIVFFSGAPNLLRSSTLLIVYTINSITHPKHRFWRIVKSATRSTIPFYNRSSAK